MSLKIDMKTLVLALLSGLWAFIPILTSYSANLGEVGLDFVLLFGLVCAVGTVCIFAVMTLIFKSPFAAFGSCVVGWFCVSASYNVILGAGRYFSIQTFIINILYGLLMLLLLFGVGYGIKKLMARYKPDEKFILTLLSVVIGVLLIVSVVPIAMYSVQVDSENSKLESNEMIFSIDETLAKPNIYWIHAESMVNKKTLEKYFGKETVGFSETLEKRGFYVNQDAKPFNSTSTTRSLAYFMCPDYYDLYENPADLSGSSVLNAYRYKNELVTAFSHVNYTTAGIHGLGGIYYDSSNAFSQIYLYDKEMPAVLLPTISSDLIELGNQKNFIMYTTYPLYLAGSLIDIWDKYTYHMVNELDPISLPEGYDSKDELLTLMNSSDWLAGEYSGFFNSAFQVIANSSSPKFVCLYAPLSHIPYIYDENGNYLDMGLSKHSVSRYYGQYIFSERIILHVVEMIQQQDPNAIIVIQGDHGARPSEGEIASFFESNVTADDVNYHVLSAIYIPEEYQTEDYKEILSNPLNIARYLVNNFVGENYEYK